MNLEQYMIAQLAEICKRHEDSNVPVDKAVLSMVLAEATEVVNAIRAKLKAVLGFLPPMPSISTSFKEGRIRVVVDTTNWIDSEVEGDAEDSIEP